MRGRTADMGPESLVMDDPKRLLKLIPTLRVTFDALDKKLPDDPVARYTRSLLAQILKMLEHRDEDFVRRRTN